MTEKPAELLGPTGNSTVLPGIGDAKVNSTDMLIARNNTTHFLNALKLIAVPATGKWDWLYEFESTDAKRPDAAKTEFLRIQVPEV